MSKIILPSEFGGGAKFSDPVPSIKGRVKVTAYADDELTKPLWVQESNNLVVTLGRRIMSRLLGGLQGGGATITTVASGPVAVSGLSDLTIQWMRWGDSGHDPSTPTTGLPVAPQTEALSNALEVTAGVFEKPVSVDYPSDVTIRFTAVLLKAEPLVQPVDLSEMGLFCGANADFLFAKVNFGQLTKHSGIALEFQHTLIA